MDRRTKGLFLLVGAVALAAVGVAVWAPLFRDPAPQPFPTLPLRWRTMPLPTGEAEDKMSQAQGGGAVNLTYSDQVTLSLGEGTLSLQVTNPARSNQSMLLCRWWCRMWWWRNLARRPGKPVGGTAAVGGVRLSPVSMRGGLPSGFTTRMGAGPR